MKFEILKADEDRIPEVAKIFRESYQQAYPNFPVLHTPDEDLEFFKNVIFKKNVIYVALAPTKEIVGFISYNHEFIDQLYIHPECQKMGLGKALLDKARANEQNLRLWTFQQNTNALEFYKKHGFTPILATDGSENEENQPDVLLEWKRSP